MTSLPGCIGLDQSETAHNHTEDALLRQSRTKVDMSELCWPGRRAAVGRAYLVPAHAGEACPARSARRYGPSLPGTPRWAPWLVDHVSVDPSGLGRLVRIYRTCLALPDFGHTNPH